ncbi:4-alpha-glucanotransferase [Pelobacter seleniigenes]|uniref:4-alpha-glucanotransferase n=1 Tax=Pelobacter seleniigenes TaxID=407188 RepID=UPI0004A6E7F9|nr:4-alpha-glucanotransferase [Pelobacter seleniigenes]
MLSQRRSGILLHPTSLPGSQAVGSLGREAYQFIDFLIAAGQSVWQLLPLGPTGFGNCPYSSFSAFAGNPLLINLELLAEAGDLDQIIPQAVPSEFVGADYDTAVKQQLPLLKQASRNFKAGANETRRQAFADFCARQRWWLDDYALFEAIRRDRNFVPWQDWPQPLRQREAAALQQEATRLQEAIFEQQYLQFVFFEQWFALKKYANSKGIYIYGDLPIFVAENSADLWAHREQYLLDDNDRPTVVAGVPPDYFSQTGQRWGNPLYNWEQMATDNYAWWLSRFQWNFSLFDLIRVDHFRGFSACWTIPADQPTAEHGYWVETPGRQLFSTLRDTQGKLPIVAEDLGIITPDVEQLRDQFEFPGMKILQFAFDSDANNPYLPHNHVPNSVIYTGTHDNNTSLGWWNHLEPAARQRIADYLLQEQVQMPWLLVQTALSSVARLAIIPLQDILSLAEEHRMNTPGTAENNWQWRYQSAELTPAIADRLKQASHLYGRNLCNPTEI